MNLRRKRLRLMRDTQWRGYARTAEGNPITLSQVRSVAALSVLGNSSQSGTPSPDNPVEVVGTGERTGNLFDVNGLQFNRLVNIADGVITVSNMTGTDNLHCAASINFELVAGKQYTVIAKSARQGTGISAGSYDCTIKLQTNTTYDGLAIDFIGKANNYGIVVNNFIAPDNINDYKYLGTRINNDTVYTFENIMLIEGAYTAENLPQYEPYGYKVAVTASGRNLFTALDREISGLKGSSPSSNKEFGDNVIVEGISSNGYVASAYTPKYSISDNIISIYPINGSGYGLGFDFDVMAGEYYSVRFTVLIGTADVSMSYYDIDGVYISREMRSSKTGAVFSSTVPDNAKKMILTISEAYGATLRHIELSNIMLVKGKYTSSTIPPYEPYKEPQSFNVYTPESLHGVGDAHDTVTLDFDRRKAELVKYAGYYNLNNIANLTYGSQPPTLNRSFFFPSPEMKAGSGLKGYCNVLIEYGGWNTADYEHVHFGANNTVIYLTTINRYNKDDMIEYLSNNGQSTPYVIYPLATPTTTDITALQQWDKLPQLRGTWVLTASGGTEPTLRAEYYSNERSTE